MDCLGINSCVDNNVDSCVNDNVDSYVNSYDNSYVNSNYNSNIGNHNNTNNATLSTIQSVSVNNLSNSSNPIPAIIHQIWIQGFEKVPDNIKIIYNECKLINYNFKFLFWDEYKIKKLLLKYFGKTYVEIYDSYTIFAQKSDFARYAILYIYGGIYLDMDMLARKNLTPFLVHEFFCTTDSIYFFMLSRRYLNGVMGSKPRHLVFKSIFKNMIERLPLSKNVIYSTGTKLLYDSVAEYKKKTGLNNISVIDRKYLHPCITYDDDSCPYTCEDCFIAHTDHNSWGSWYGKFTHKYILKNLKIVAIIVAIIVLYLIYRMLR